MPPRYITIVIICCLQLVNGVRRPNIVFIVADDLGYNDVGYNAREHESKMKTPFLDELAASGVRLENYYVQSSCSPSRTQLMSGRDQIHTGLQHKIRSARRSGLPLDNKIIPEQLQHCGYDTHMVGKWHLGLFRREYTPMYRGFNSFFGTLAAAGDHYTHEFRGYVDMNDNNQPTDEYRGVYSTHLFTDKAMQAIRNRNASKPFFLYLAHKAVHSPMQVPDQYLLPFMDIEDKVRRTYAGMVLALDESVQNVSMQLEQSEMLDDTIFIFSTDNGGAPKYGGNNWPFRGGKNKLTEGGVKAVGFVSGRPLGVSGVKSQNFMHISDWLPTILGASGCPLMRNTPPLDGYDQWDAILQTGTPPRRELLHALDPMRRHPQRKEIVHGFDTSIWAALRVGPWKIVTGGGKNNIWTPPPESGRPVVNETRGQTSPFRLYNIESDPYEQHELSASHPNVVRRLLKKLAAYHKDSVPVLYPKDDKASKRSFRRTGFWAPWVTTKSTKFGRKGQSRRG